MAYLRQRNVMIADDGSPILMDFGSAIKARIPIQTRQQALLQQVSKKEDLHSVSDIHCRTLLQNKVQWHIVHQSSSTLKQESQ